LTGRDHELLCRAYGLAPAFRHPLTEPVSDFAFWRNRLEDRRGEVVFGLLLTGGRIALTRTSEYPSGVYRVPSGGIRPGERAVDALYREVEEELGRPFEVLRYAGMVSFEFSCGGSLVVFPSYCFLLGELVRPRRAAPPQTDGEIEAVFPATPAELDAHVRALDALDGPWADWGRYRACSSRLVASAWSAGLAPGDSGAATGSEGAEPPGRLRDELVDVSLKLGGDMVRYPGDAPVHGDVVTARPPGDSRPGWLVTSWTLNAHAGTHVDAPAHLLPGGRTVDELPPGELAGPGLVVDCRRATAAGRAVAAADLPGPEELKGKIVLLKLGLGRELAAGRYDPSAPVLGADCALFLVETGVRAVGVDTLSVDRAGDEPAAHKILLGADLPLIEGLDLSQAASGEWEVFALPLSLAGAEAAPCRAVLRRPRRPSRDATGPRDCGERQSP